MATSAWAFVPSTPLPSTRSSLGRRSQLRMDAEADKPLAKIEQLKVSFLCGPCVGVSLHRQHSN